MLKEINKDDYIVKVDPCETYDCKNCIADEEQCQWLKNKEVQNNG